MPVHVEALHQRVALGDDVGLDRIGVLLLHVTGLQPRIVLAFDLLGEDTPDELLAAEDKAFFREYQRMTPALKAKLREMRRLLDE